MQQENLNYHIDLLQVKGKMLRIFGLVFVNEFVLRFRLSNRNAKLRKNSSYIIFGPSYASSRPVYGVDAELLVYCCQRF